MLTFFTVPKPFVGHFGVIQRNAITSWLTLFPGCQVLLHGNDPGTREVAAELGATHVPAMAQNEYGTPLLDGLFHASQKMAEFPVLCYVNCDILFRNDLLAALERVLLEKSRFLLMAECWNLDVTEPLTFDVHWERRMALEVARRGKKRGQGAIDFMVFTRGFFQEIPAFAMGRAWFDSWFIHNTLERGETLIDASAFIHPVHQNHDYSHVSGGWDWSYQGIEAQKNLQLAGGKERFCGIYDATHYLGDQGLKSNFFRRLRRRSLIVAARLQNDFLSSYRRLKWWLIERSSPLRRRWGLSRGPKTNQS